MKLFRLFFIFFIFEVGAKPKISIIIPVYNTEQFLRECLDSILNQTFKDFEVICINDASPDHCSEILREYAEKDKRVRVVNHEKNAGMAAARNTGLDVAEGEYISFCDSDDYIHPDMLKIMYTEIRRNNCDLAICRIWTPKEHDRPTFLKNFSYALNFFNNSLLRKICNSIDVMWFSACNKMYKKSAIASVRFDSQMFYAEDAYFNICIARFIEKYVTIDAELYDYRQYANSSTKLKSPLYVQKRIRGCYKWIENIYNSSYDSIPLSFEQKRIICCGIAAFVVGETMFYHFKYDNVIYASEQIYDLYSRGFIDISHSEGFLKKIFIVPFVVIGKIRSWFKVS